MCCLYIEIDGLIRIYTVDYACYIYFAVIYIRTYLQFMYSEAATRSQD